MAKAAKTPFLMRSNSPLVVEGRVVEGRVVEGRVTQGSLSPACDIPKTMRAVHHRHMFAGLIWRNRARWPRPTSNRSLIMKRFLAAAIALGLLASAGAASAHPWHHHHHRHHHH